MSKIRTVADNLKREKLTKFRRSIPINMQQEHDDKLNKAEFHKNNEDLSKYGRMTSIQPTHIAGVPYE